MASDSNIIARGIKVVREVTGARGNRNKRARADKNTARLWAEGGRPEPEPDGGRTGGAVVKSEPIVAEPFMGLWCRRNERGSAMTNNTD